MVVYSLIAQQESGNHIAHAISAIIVVQTPATPTLTAEEDDGPDEGGQE